MDRILLGAAVAVVVALTLPALARLAGGGAPEVLTRAAPPPGERIAYGPGPHRFGHLRVPAGAGPHPVAIVIHGGCWLSAFDLGYMEHLSAALAGDGIATWNIEYRRLGQAGGGWPGTFEDVAAAADHLRVIAETHDLNLDSTVSVGHSAGGHLALWLAGRRGLPAAAPGAVDPLPLRGVVALAPVADLARGGSACDREAARLAPPDDAARLAMTSPARMLPLGVPQRVVHGAIDRLVPPGLGRAYAAAAAAAGDDAIFTEVPGADHFAPIDPESPAWPAVSTAVADLLSR